MGRKITSNLMRLLVGNRSTKGIKISHQGKLYNELRDMQWRTADENDKIQRERLYAIVKFALTEVPYYRELGLDISNFSIDTIKEDLKQLPILTKDIIRKEKERLYPDCKVKDWTFFNVSGGTTGEPVRFRHSGRFFDYDQAGKLLFDEWAGRKPGESQVRLWGSERDIISGKKDWMNKVYRWCRNEVFLNSFRMSDDVMEEYVNKINRIKPKMILAYVQSARELAQYVEKNRLTIWNPSGIMTSAGNLDDDTYKLLSRVFKCPILNRYGSREMGDMACSCDRNEGLHINMLTSYIEVIDDDGNPCEKEQVGNIITTLLSDYSMPIIRYQIGDRGALSSKTCSCGKGWAMMKNVVGRTVDVFKSPQGDLIDGEYFTHIFYTESNVKQFQIVQDKINHITIKIVFYDKEKVSNDFYTNLEEKFKLVMGEEMNFSYEYPDYIPVGKSGKRAYTISLL